jgi:hypothetical protein
MTIFVKNINEQSKALSGNKIFGEGKGKRKNQILET